MYPSSSSFSSTTTTVEWHLPPGRIPLEAEVQVLWQDGLTTPVGVNRVWALKLPPLHYGFKKKLVNLDLDKIIFNKNHLTYLFQKKKQWKVGDFSSFDPLQVGCLGTSNWNRMICFGFPWCQVHSQIGPSLTFGSKQMFSLHAENQSMQQRKTNKTRNQDIFSCHHLLML